MANPDLFKCRPFEQRPLGYTAKNEGRAMGAAADCEQRAVAKWCVRMTEVGVGPIIETAASRRPVLKLAGQGGGGTARIPLAHDAEQASRGRSSTLRAASL